MKMRKLIAVVSAVAMLMTGMVSVNAGDNGQEALMTVSAEETMTVGEPAVPEHTYLHGKYYEMPFENYMSGDFNPGEYAIGNAEKAKWVYENNEGNGKVGRSKITTANVVSGNRALYLYAQNGGDGALYNPGAKMTLHFGKLVGDGTYTIQFDMANWNIDYRDYVALNMDGWDRDARIEDGTIWTRGEKLTPSHNGDNLDYYRYTGTVNTLLDPELSFAVWGYGRMVIDNIIIKDSEGTIIFSEGFEGGIPEGWVDPGESEDPDEPENPDEPGVTVDLTTPKHTYLHGRFYEMPFENYMSGDFEPGEYAIGNAEKAKWVYENHEGNGKVGRSKITTANVVSGDRALYLYAQNGGNGALYNPGAKMTLHFGKLVGDGTYTIQFDMAPWSPDWRDYVALNMDGWDSSAKIKDGEGGTIWTKGEKLTPSKNGDNLEYYRYTGTVNTLLDPELSFAVWGYSRMVIDNIIIKDSEGTIIFSEGFEGGIPEGWEAPDEPETPDEPVDPETPEVDLTKPKHTYLHGQYYKMPFEKYLSGDFEPGEYAIGNAGKWVYENNEGNGKVGRSKITTANVASGARALYLYAHNGGDGALYNPGAKMTVHLGKLTGDGTYTIQFDMASWHTDYRDFVALNMEGWEEAARIKEGYGGTTWTRGEMLTPSKNEDNVSFYRYTGTVTTAADPELTFAVWGYGRMSIDNIIIKDSEGTIVFSEGFEGGFPEGWEVPDEPSALTEVTYTISNGKQIDSPIGSFVGKEVPSGTYVSQRNKNVRYEISYTGSSYGKLSNSLSAAGENCFFLYGAAGTAEGTNGTARISFFLGKMTADGKYNISFDLHRGMKDWQDYITLNEANWNSGARLDSNTMWSVTELGNVGKDGRAWSHYEATISTKFTPQLDVAAFGYGRIYIDNIIVKDTEGNIIFAEGFENLKVEEGSFIYDAEFEVVEKNGDSYTTVAKAEKLTANTLLKTSVKIENLTEDEAISAYVYTTLYKDNYVIGANRQFISAEKGSEVSSNGILNIPSLDDGVYTVKVFVWDNDMDSLKNVMVIGE